MTARTQLLMGGGGGSAHPRPQPVRQNPLPPWDASDNYWPYNQVHTTIPTGIPPNPTRNFWRHDPWGVTLKQTPPLVPGGNTTPREMVMSYQLPLYQQPWIDLILTEHAESGLSHCHFDRGMAVNAIGLQKTSDLVAYVQSCGFFTSFWLCGTGDDRSGGWPMLQPMIEPFLQILIAQGLADNSIALVGEELNSGCVPGGGPNGLDGLINGVCAITNPVGIPTWLHFTQNVPAWQAPGQDSVAWWGQFVGKLKGLCSQLNPDDSAGAQGAHLWDARWRLAQASLDYRVVAFEIMATAQLYGRCTEEYGCLRGLENVYCPSGAPTPNAPAVAGFGNGGRYPDGSAI